MGDFTAYLYAAMLSSGPWLMSIISLAVLGIFSGVVLSFTEHEIFRSTVIYTYAFFVGALVSVICALYLGEPMKEEGFLLGYLLGQALTFFWLLAKLLLEFPATAIWDHDFISIFKKYWDLILIGFFFNFAIWVDKIVFWLAPDSRMIIPYFRAHDLYEAPIFFSYLTIVPTLCLNLQVLKNLKDLY